MDNETTPAPTQRRGLMAILGYLRPYPGWVLAAVGLLLLIISIEMTIPRVVGAALDALRGQTGTRNMMGWLLSLVGARLVLGWLLGPIRNRLVQRALADLRADIYATLLRQSFAFHDRMNTGDLISRSTTDAWRIQDFFFACLFLSVDIVVALMSITVLIFVISPLLGAVTLATFAPAIGLLAWFAARLQPRWRSVHDQHGAMTNVIQENIAGVRVVRAFAQENGEIAKYQARQKEFLGTLMTTVNEWAARVPLTQFLFGLTTPLVLWIGGVRVIRGDLAVGDLTAIILYLMAIGHRLGMIGQFTNIVQNASAAAERIMELLDAPVTLQDVPQNARQIVQVSEPESAAPSTPTNQSSQGRTKIEFRNVSLAYPGGRLALRDINLRITDGDTIAIIGATGSGKSTLISLIPRFRDPSSGAVLIDGIDIRQQPLAHLRSQIAMAFQEPFLFNATIAENIAFSRPDASTDAIEKAAEQAYAIEFIHRLERGMDTIIGERGITLSGGQKQRIALARAFLTDPKILILDDSTAAVDARTEHQILEAMQQLSVGRTTVVVAHRANGLLIGNKTFAMHDGSLNLICEPR
jgi:ABC-type multidrug transport system fused ATPase/permease subunit